MVSENGDIVFGFQSNKQKFHDFDLTHNWAKQSIFSELPYWKTNLLCHNLEVIHIENNVFDNIFRMVTDVKRKTNDNINARMDIALFCHCKNIELVYLGSWVAKPKASFAIDKILRFPNGYASNISRLVNSEDCRLYKMKSHDYHMFMQTLIALAYQDLLSNEDIRYTHGDQ